MGPIWAPCGHAGRGKQQLGIYVDQQKLLNVSLPYLLHEFLSFYAIKITKVTMASDVFLLKHSLETEISFNTSWKRQKLLTKNYG